MLPRAGQHILILQNLYGEAKANFELARNVFVEMDRPVSAARCMERLGDIYRGEDLLDAAEDQLRAALDIYTKAGALLDTANCRRSIGMLLQSRKNYSAAETEFAAAQAQYKVLGSRLMSQTA